MASAALRWTHVTTEIPALDVVRHGAALGPVSAIWTRPDQGEAVCAVGVAAESSTLQPLLECPVGADPLPHGPWLGGMAFDGRTSWEGVPSARFILPELMLWRRGGHTYFSAFSVVDSDDVAALHDRLRARVAHIPPPYTAESTPSISRLVEDRASWDALLDGALTDLEHGALSKVVLARALEATCSTRIDPIRVVTTLMERYPACQSFLFALPDGSFFVGATPETLLRMRGRTVETEALAGSAPPDSGAALLSSEKDLREHRLVVEFLRERLGPLCGHFEIPSSPTLRALPNITHLLTPVRARLAPGVSLSDVIGALHPTPAVAGTPQHLARDFIFRREKLRRGWYTGPIGMLGSESSHLCVALRCARIRGEHATLFAGAGIVSGSTAEAEWNETRRKAMPLLDALTGGAHGEPQR